MVVNRLKLKESWRLKSEIPPERDRQKRDPHVMARDPFPKSVSGHLSCIRPQLEYTERVTNSKDITKNIHSQIYPYIYIEIPHVHLSTFPSKQASNGTDPP
jgi:hypothetical protein